MSEVEKQESQKTVVAFITGLLIGGLLVWVFSSSPETAKAPADEEVVTEESVSADTETKTEEVAKEEVSKTEIIGKGALTVADQKAGKQVVLDATEFPTKSGWIVVRDFMDGIPGNVLGAARFGADEGLVPTSVELMREMTAGSSYQVVFYTNEGEGGFSLTEDKLIDGTAVTFKAK